MASSAGNTSSVLEPKLKRPSGVFSSIRWEHCAAGVCGGVISTLALHPLDLIKIRFQVNEGNVPSQSTSVSQRPQYRSIRDAFVTIARQEGLRGLYQGVTPNVWGAGVSWGLYFLFYNAAKTRLQEQKANSQQALSAGQHMWAACQAGICTLVITNPVWVAKTRLCLQYDTMTPKTANAATIQYQGMADCLRKIFKYEGIRGLYKGFLPGVVGVSHGALQFMAYEELKKMYNNYHKRPHDTKFTTAEYLTFAALSKIFAAGATYPYQVVRSRLQDQHRQYAGIMDVLKSTYRYEGAQGFYKGLGPSLLRVTPACCITFVVYETLVQYLMGKKQPAKLS